MQSGQVLAVANNGVEVVGTRDPLRTSSATITNSLNEQAATASPEAYPETNSSSSATPPAKSAKKKYSGRDDDDDFSPLAEASGEPGSFPGTSLLRERPAKKGAGLFGFLSGNKKPTRDLDERKVHPRGPFSCCFGK